MLIYTSKPQIYNSFQYFIMDNSEIKAYWDKVAGIKQFTLGLRSDLLMQHINNPGSVLDLGCGNGRMLHELDKLGFSPLSGCDVSPKMIELAQKVFPKADLKVNTGSILPFDDNSFDTVVVLAVLTAIPDSSEQKQLINEIHRVLEPGGIVYIGDFLLNDDERNIARYQKYLKAHGTYGIFELPEEGAILRHHDPEYIKELLKPFETLDMTRVTHRTMNGHTSNGFYLTGKAV